MVAYAEWHSVHLFILLALCLSFFLYFFLSFFLQFSFSWFVYFLFLFLPSFLQFHFQHDFDPFRLNTNGSLTRIPPRKKNKMKKYFFIIQRLAAWLVKFGSDGFYQTFARPEKKEKKKNFCASRNQTKNLLDQTNV